MADSKLEIILTAKDLAAGTFHSVTGYVTRLTSSIFSLKGAFGLLAGGAGAGLVIHALDKLSDKASDFSETMSKSLTLFGSEEAKRVDEWAQGAAEAMGLSRQASTELSATMGTMFVQLGAGVETASGLSRGMIQLSADIASYNNVAGGAQAVSEAMLSAFRGEYDALQRYIPTINAAAVQQQALADTGKRSAAELSQLDKALATQKIIMRDAGAAAGDFARTSGELANQERILDARVADLQVRLGQGLLPIKTKIVTEISNWVDANADLLSQNMGQWADNLSQSFDGMARSLGVIADTLVTISKYAGLRSISRTAEQGAELAKQGKLDLEEFLKSGFLERQEMVDAILNDQTGKRFKIKVPVEIEPFKPSGVSEFPPIAAGAAKAAGELEKQIKALDAAIKASNENPWDPIGYDIDTGGIDEVAAGIQKIELERNNRRLETLRNIAVQNGIEDTYTDQGDPYAGMVDEAQRAADEMIAAFTGWGNSFAQTLTDAVWGAEDAFDGILESFGKMITQMVIQKKVVEPIFSNLFPGATKNNALGGAYASPSLASYDGMVTNKPHFFTFANGGVFGEAGWEGIFPLKTMPNGELGVRAAGAAPNVTINFIDNVGVRVSEKKKQTPQGLQIDVLIDQVQAGNASRRGSYTNRALRNTYGAREQLVAR
jgi:hypothetical protein